MDDYEKLLERARSQIPPDAFRRSGERFQVPEVEILVQGSRSIWQNFQDIVSILNRPGKAVLEYISGQLATAGNIEGSRAVFNGKFEADVVDAVLKRYIEQYVICPVCGRPDTNEVREHSAYYLVCSACGAKTSIRPI
ncbi:MAG: translation initiation factor IF-2 subunit beta [Candidatus Thorarchaeota archaeon]